MKRYRPDSAERTRQWRINNPEKALQSSRRWRLNNPEKARDCRWSHKLRSLYGLTVQQYNQMFLSQGGTCAICKKAPKLKKDGTARWGAKRLAVDHNHWTGKIRGLLCHSCNSTIVGRIEAYRIDPQAIVDYLKGRSWQDALKEPK